MIRLTLHGSRRNVVATLPDWCPSAVFSDVRHRLSIDDRDGRLRSDQHAIPLPTVMIRKECTNEIYEGCT